MKPWITTGAALAIALFALAGCVTVEQTNRAGLASQNMRPEDREVFEVQSVVMKKALGGLRDLDEAALTDSGWIAGLEEARRIRQNPALMNRGIKHQLVDKKYRVHYFLEKKDAPTTATQAAPAPAPDPAPAPRGEGGRTWILVTVPALDVGTPLAQTIPYVFLVRKVGVIYQITNSDFIPEDYMAGKSDDEIIRQLMVDVG